MDLPRLRSWCYWTARRLGDVQAIRRGRVAARLWNLLIGRVLARWIPWR